MASRPLMSGRSRTTRRSKRPGRRRAGVEDVGAVGGGDDDDVGALVEAVHLDEYLVEGLLALVVAAADACAAVPAHGVDLVDEEDGGGVLLGAAEEVADAACPDADEHLDELAAADGEEGDAGLARDGLADEGLTGAGRADEEHAARDASADAGELLGVLEELDDFGELDLGLVNAGNVLEGDGGSVFGDLARLAPAEVHRLVQAAPRTAEEVDEQGPEEDEGEEGDEKPAEVEAGPLDDDLDAV